MKIDGLAARLNISDEALAKTQDDLGLAEGSELSSNDLNRLKDVLVKTHGVDPQALKSCEVMSWSDPGCLSPAQRGLR